jgi:hypothetical protein
MGLKGQQALLELLLNRTQSISNVCKRATKATRHVARLGTEILTLLVGGWVLHASE